MFSLKQRLKAAKKACREINRVRFANIQQKAKDAMLSLKSVQERLLTAPTDSLFREEFVARKKCKIFEAAQNIFFIRKSRVRWLKDGDTNTSSIITRLWLIKREALSGTWLTRRG